MSAVALTAAWFGVASHAKAQSAARVANGLGSARLDGGGAFESGGEGERYWRALQVAGLAPYRPLGIRPVDGAVLTDTSHAHPWQTRWVRTGGVRALSFQWLRPGARVTWNSSTPTGTEVGPAWTGRGVTAEVRAGVLANVWRLHLQLEPVAWQAQNQAFPLVNEAVVGSGDPRFAGNIDLPQRFGTKAYGRIDPGNSTAWVELPLVNVGLSARAQTWGPAREFPLMLSPNAGGFPHLYAGTRDGLPIGIGRLHWRVMGGAPAQSAWSPLPDSIARWAMGVAATFTPRGLPGLEVGGTRFIHALAGRRWPALGDYRRLFTGGLSGTGKLNLSTENQLASAFFRWQPPRARFAAYGELLRDDYSLDVRRGLQYPDDLRSYLLGIERVLIASSTQLRTLHAEFVNAELPSSNLGERGGSEDVRRFGTPFPPYLHGGVLQGHTARGQLLGSPTAYGGAGWRLGYSNFTPVGRRSFRVERQMRLDWLRGVRADSLVAREVRYGVVAEQLRFQGMREWLLTVAPSIDLNHGLERGRHRANLRLALSVRGLR
jgi:hypothetical protein